MMSQQSYPIPPWMFGAVQNTESGGDPNAVSPAGAMGPMQVMPNTASNPGFGVMPAVDNSPQELQRVGNDYLGAMMNRYQDPKLALMAYNWGPGHVDKLVSGQISPDQIPAETQAYVPKVMNQQPGTQYAQNENIQSDAQPDRSRIETELKLKAMARLRLRGQQQATQPQQPNALDSFMSGATAPFNPIVNDTLESLKDTATQTGQAVFEPYNESNVPNWMIPFDIGAKTLGKLGNVIGGTGQALFSPVIGGLTASSEATMPLQERMLGVNPGDITPQQEHEIAQTEGGMAAGGVAGAMGANAKTNMTSPLPKPYDPLQPVWDKMGQMSADNSPRAGFMESNSSDPFAQSAPDSYSPQQIRKGAKFYYDSSEAKGGIMNQNSWDNAVDNAVNQSGVQTTKGKMMAGNNFVTDAQERLTQLKGSNTSLAEIGEIDDDFQDRIGQAFRAGADKQAVALMKMRDALRKASSNAGKGNMVNPNGFDDWQTGDKLWTAHRAGEDVQNIIENGEKADVPSTAIKNGFKTFVKNERNRAPFTDEEWAALNKAAETGIVTAALKSIGGKLITGIAGGTSGFAGGGIPGAIAGAGVGQAIGFPFRAAATALQRGRGNNVVNMIGLRPEVQAAMKNLPPGFNP